MPNNNLSQEVIMAIPKGRILDQLVKLLDMAGIKLEDDFYGDSRKLKFATNFDFLKVIKCRSYDAATFVAYGAADFGICGSDVIDEFAYKNLYEFLDLEIGKCRLSIAGNQEMSDPLLQEETKVATKYPNLTKEFFASRAIRADIIKLNGAIELATQMGLCDYIVDLVSTGNTLKENGLQEFCSISKVSSKLVINRSSFAVRNSQISQILNLFIDATN